MFENGRPDLPYFTTGYNVRGCELAEVLLAGLVPVVDKLARTRPDASVTPDLLRLARAAIRPARRLAREMRLAELPPLHEPVTHAGLAARLAVASQHCAKFRAHFCRYQPEERRKIWHVHPWIVRAIEERVAMRAMEQHRAGLGPLE